MEAYGVSPVIDVDRAYNISHSHDLHLRTGDVGILRSTILPSFALHSGLSVASFIAAKATDRGEIKDWNWPSSQVINAWWSALGRPMYYNNISFTDAWSSLPWTEKVLLGGVTAWGTRLFYRIVSRTLARGKDDPRYDELKAKDPAGFWKTAFFKLFAPEAVFLTFISLPFTLPFCMTHSAISVDPDVSKSIRALGVGLFSAGFAMEVMADTQLELHRGERTDLCRHGVWSIVRHPNYLGDSLVHFSFILLNAANTFNPLVLLGPIANYVYLRFVGGDKQNEASQEERYEKEDPQKYAQLLSWRNEKNSFWPSVSELANPWTWAVLGSGFIGVFVEETARCYLA
ncbi:hypothetical protein ASPWEDRAFT_118486 [Aspergillus wentii DTO 134E9]|uniref:Steroid 5-alpha reductase C-terminal domain-containing protein n=1 Tax=Aspergillus wentii DTO 134E9 TaxID=1073089 RepID=A0A1L9R8J5_ASPWE|nr:uncharacterized protein ASPWEDRAFT_118486 [Aspergillus wentii DTO 134E9]KAI9925055.1 hypothetical protein MW887_006463 [Aspergillus wentii]OJJ31231.1 hypothetical protein ASPWEDRAFT_118486 [Aspergillus wentii DTO 134E9]